MKRFNVTVNGIVYDVTVEEVDSNAAHAPVEAKAPVAVAPTAAPKAAPKANAPASAGKAGSITIKSPMPGTIMKVNATVGASVKKGDVLCVLEAMKMENDICAPSDGTVASVNVQKGASVQTDEVLVTLN